MELENCAALVTGGARGIGRGLAVALAAKGVDVLVADLVDDPSIAREAAETVRLVKSLGRDAVAVSCDVRREDETAAAVDAALARFGHLDIACANAGVIREGQVAGGSLADWTLTLDVNLTGAFLLARSAIPPMTARGRGIFLVTSSVAAYRGGVGYAAYCASKAGLLGFTRALATEVAPFGVRANALCPGYLATDMWFKDILPSLGAGDRDEQFAAVVRRAVPLGTSQTPADIGQAAVYLCEADSVTGIALSIDGGHLAGP